MKDNSIPERIINIYLVIDKGVIKELKVKDYEITGTDNEKITYLKSRAQKDYENALSFPSPTDNSGKLMPYELFEKFELQGIQFNLFEHIFSEYCLGENPIVCITPVVEGKIIIN